MTGRCPVGLQGRWGRNSQEAARFSRQLTDQPSISGAYGLAPFTCTIRNAFQAERRQFKNGKNVRVRCYPCRGGFYTPKVGDCCIACDNGFVQVIADNEATCIKCPGEGAVPSRDSSTDTKMCMCKAGYQANGTTDTGAITGCTPCPAGSASPNKTISKTACQPCMDNTVAPTPGMSRCFECKNTSTAVNGTSCACPANFYLKAPRGRGPRPSPSPEPKLRLARLLLSEGGSSGSGKGKDDNPGKGSDDNPGKGKDDNPGKGKDDNPGKGGNDNPGKGGDDGPGKGGDDHSGGKGSDDDWKGFLRLTCEACNSTAKWSNPSNNTWGDCCPLGTSWNATSRACAQAA
ncbi:hypothetical protein OEZ85_000914 [Tetradesmus obliquus]|uniref:Tyrosine-protein kinase ephrin type A/B receptor-like domain-containing protein n=1 Tax=Tetradesmus obliquus TaxID=3088 RepID=A0ABY8UN94_TETOB|nr:hypothetical protein OEZ85_000914 [Tetradesmus obliquus]